MDGISANLAVVGGAGERVFDAGEVWGMIVINLLAAAAGVTTSQVGVREILPFQPATLLCEGISVNSKPLKIRLNIEKIREARLPDESSNKVGVNVTEDSRGVFLGIYEAFFSKRQYEMRGEIVRTGVANNARFPMMRIRIFSNNRATISAETIVIVDNEPFDNLTGVATCSIIPR